jgi:hypothetical protein
MATETNQGKHIGNWRFAMIAWSGNVPFLEIWQVESHLDLGSNDEVIVNGTYRNSKVSLPVDDETYATYGAEFINSLPMSEWGIDIPQNFFLEVF